MKNFTLIACLTLGLISCSNTGYEKKIPGSWCPDFVTTKTAIL